jgi:hypothetical protein
MKVLHLKHFLIELYFQIGLLANSGLIFTHKQLIEMILKSLVSFKLLPLFSFGWLIAVVISFDSG